MTDLKEQFRHFTQAASQTDASADPFLDQLAKDTGYPDVPTMLTRFRKLAGLERSSDATDKSTK